MNLLNYRTINYIAQETAVNAGASNIITVPDMRAPVDRWITIVEYSSATLSSHGGGVDNSGDPLQDFESSRGLISTFNIKRKIRDAVSAIKGRKMFHVRGSVLVDQTLAAAKEQGIPAEEIKLLEEQIEAQKKAEPEEPDVDPEDLKDKDDGGSTEEGSEDSTKKAGKKAGKKSGKKAKSGKKNGKTAKRGTLPSVAASLAREYWDQRTFGAPGVESSNYRHIGAVQFPIAQSLHRIDLIELPMTNCAVVNHTEKAKKDNNIGRFQVVRFGLYEITMCVNPSAASKIGFSWEDLNDLLNGLRSYPNVLRTSRTAGVEHEKGYVFVHHCANTGNDDNLANIVELVRPCNAPSCMLGDNEARLSMDQYSMVDVADVVLPESIQSLITF
jgi:Cas7 group CRISPR-associated protein Csh2